MWKSNKVNNNILKIGSLRQEVSLLLTCNNDIVEQLWEIDQKLQLSGTEEKTKEKLLARKKVLSEKLEKENYLEKISALKEKIHDLEIEEFGQSDIPGNLPGKSNSLIL